MLMMDITSFLCGTAVAIHTYYRNRLDYNYKIKIFKETHEKWVIRSNYAELF
ncbi:hypothetical protein CHISP_3333 [Chitinispirillum alkaliphilum]|nr:hypothetical protein CHISP_3333 [Chitinispirillum alkaliphilum]